jgi:hypothetical protein
MRRVLFLQRPHSRERTRCRLGRFKGKSTGAKNPLIRSQVTRFGNRAGQICSVAKRSPRCPRFGRMGAASRREIDFIKARLTGEKPNLDENRMVTVDLRLCRRQLELRVVLTPVWRRCRSDCSLSLGGKTLSRAKTAESDNHIQGRTGS